MKRLRYSQAAGRAVQIALFSLLAFAGCGKKTEQVLIPILPSRFSWTLQRPLPLGANSYYCVSGISANSIFVGGVGSIARLDGRRWKIEDAGGYVDAIVGVWAASDKDVFAVGGFDGAVLHYDGVKWKIVRVLPGMNAAVWGTSGRDVWAVGSANQAAHYNGEVWAPVSLGNRYSLHDIWGSAADDIYAVGDSGAVVHYNGASWSRIDHGLTRERLRAVWGSRASDVWTVGENGTVLHFDGATWSLVKSPQVSSWDLYAISGTGASDFYVAASSSIWHCDGSTFTKIAGYETVDGVQGMWATSGRLVCASALGLIFIYDGSTWTEAQDGPFWSLNDVWTDGPNNAWAVGDAGAILHYDGVRWSDESNPAVTQNGLQAISGTRNSLYAVGYRGIILHYDGNRWADISNGGVTDWSLTDVWAVGNEAFAVGVGGALGNNSIVHVKGTSWSLMDIPPMIAPLYGVWGSAPNDVFAVGRYGTILHYNGVQWSLMKSPGVYDDFSCIWGTGRDNVYAIGDFSGILHYDGNAWAVASEYPRFGIVGIWGTSSTDLYGIGDGGLIRHLDGTQWVDARIPGATTPLLGIMGSSPHDIFAVGERGLIVHYGP